MKTCPVCGARCFDDMDVCYGCMHRFDEHDETTPSAQATAVLGGGGGRRPEEGALADLSRPTAPSRRPAKPAQQTEPAAVRACDETTARAFGARPAEPGAQAGRTAFGGQGLAPGAGAPACQNPSSGQDRPPQFDQRPESAAPPVWSPASAPSAHAGATPSSPPAFEAPKTEPSRQASSNAGFERRDGNSARNVPDAQNQPGSSGASRPFLQGMSVASAPFFLTAPEDGACYQVVVTLRPCAKPSREGRPAVCPSST